MKGISIIDTTIDGVLEYGVYGLTPNIVNLKNAKEAQESPCAFGIFCIIYNGKIIAEHPISNTRFSNIMKNLVRFAHD